MVWFHLRQTLLDLARRHRELLLWVLAGMGYVILGLLLKQALAWMIEAAIYLWLVFWLIPDGIKALRERRRSRERQGE